MVTRKGKGEGSYQLGGGINKSTIIHLKQVINKDRCIARSSTQHPVATYLRVKNLYVELKDSVHL